MTKQSIRTWVWLHKWSSLVCTVFMLMLGLTGLPLIFEHEIAHFTGADVEPVELPADHPRISLDRVMEIAISQYPDKVGMFVSQDPDDDRVWYVTLSKAPNLEEGLKQVAVDARTGDVVAEPALEGGVMNFIESLHVDMFAGLPGMVFLGFMGVLLLIALVSGVVLYAPFMRKLGFAQVRTDKEKPTKWLDVHNALGIVTLVWFFVVGGTGVINAWGELLFMNWQRTHLADMVAPYKDKAPLQQLGSLQAAVNSALALEPKRTIQFIAFPGTGFSSPHHYGVFLRGSEPVTAHTSKPVLVDASTAEVTASESLPWYLTALQVSQPLHFGDYGGLPMQIIWAILNIFTMIVLGSGLYLWWVKYRKVSA
ncbi:MAG: PepSY domain-containing protein [Gammaproteobacteria bacterium]|uniref:PepSY-associated TM helix domain-containing protein n=1 Tax=Limnobacter sp. TaxID=2003368 RepID=UPI001DBE46E6|nr:PepSY domain-containing protein [Limnobacter sp.]MBU0785017.1 PepSY domain-containing protein [Gammaproteobacteria bacterium]MBU0849055.1 PepSY domain-containing protein [Gammaproteobacteria bacterium]MBU1781392.1 PepSY domain-containing protein [Gammaproteobacteria bacterium]MBU2086772.1 PepSY domain-containing protein [Gammaproteobacteria bacterium]MBU2128200.1 PepSY domain-containing protein [Gammaproteobacteria bacterium]